MGTTFFLTKDEFSRMEYDYLVAIRTMLEERVRAASTEAENNFRAKGLKDDKLHVAVLLDRKVNDEKSMLRYAREAVVRERIEMLAERKLNQALAMTY